MRYLAVLAMICVGSAASAAETPNFSGDWWSTRCARISLSQTGDRLSGSYTSQDSTDHRVFELSGYAAADLIAFVVKTGAGWADRNLGRSVHDGAGGRTDRDAVAHDGRCP